MSRRSRRESEEFNLSFLDVICCGFGAIILLLMITKIVEPMVLEQSTLNLEGKVTRLQQELVTTRGEATVLRRDLTSRQEQLSKIVEQIARLQAELSAIQGRFAATTADAESESDQIGRLEQAKQTLTEEMRRLLGNARKRSDHIGGIPVDSEYVIFIVDTSGSMFNYAWPRMQQELLNTLNIYPQVKGLQIVNDMGEYMFSRYRGEWIPDTPGRRKAIMQRVKTWNPFSNSSPVEGIQRTIRTFFDPDKKISLYVFGDEFTGESITQVIDSVDRFNQRNSDGERLVRIHAIGFPVQFARPSHLQTTGIRFATLMRELTFRNGGTFVGLNDFR